jgi:hypothetical protein
VLDIYGPNPDPKPEKYAQYWTPTILYMRGPFGKGFKGLPFAYWKKENIERTEYEGYDGFIDAIARRTLHELQAKFDKGK